VYETKRRSVYLMQQRLKKNPYLATFDGADPSSSTAVRLPSTTPLQALFLMNDPFAHNAASKLAARVRAGRLDEAARLEFIYQLTLNRALSGDEFSECSEFLEKYRAKLAARGIPAPQAEVDSWSALARVLLGSNEFAFID
jgi:hypothetical protein